MPLGAQPLRDLFATADDAPPMQLSVLATSLNIPLVRLLPLAQHGYLTLRSEGDISGDSYVDALPEPAIIWLRSWFLQPRAKPIFSMADMMELMQLPSKRVLQLAASHDIPVVFDEALGGHFFSAWTAKRMLTIRMLPKLNGRGPGQVEATIERFDRQSLLWRIMEGDPSRAKDLPKWSEKLEEEIERVANLEEPMRSIRTQKLLDAFRDVRVVAESAGMDTASIAADEEHIGKRLRLVS